MRRCYGIFLVYLSADPSKCLKYLGGSSHAKERTACKVHSTPHLCLKADCYQELQKSTLVRFKCSAYNSRYRIYGLENAVGVVQQSCLYFPLMAMGQNQGKVLAAGTGTCIPLPGEHHGTRLRSPGPILRSPTRWVSDLKNPSSRQAEHSQPKPKALVENNFWGK